MKIFLIVFLCLFSFSFETIQAAFFCEDLLQEVYLIDQSTGQSTKIGYGNVDDSWDAWETPNYFYNLGAEQGDKIMINCYSHLGWADTYGGGCFLINGNCRCYDFNSEREPYEYHERSAKLDSKDCNIRLGRCKVDRGIYSYRYQIPLDTGGITCKTDVLIFLYGQNYDLAFSNYITANFGLKNLEISILQKPQLFDPL